MVFVALLVAAVAMLSLSLLTVLRASQKEGQSSREDLSALYACEAGLSAALQELVQGASGSLGTANAPRDFGSNNYWVQASDLGNRRTSLVAIGRDDRSALGVELVVQRQASGFFQWAAFGDEILHMDSNARTDSYDSGDGTYASQAVNDSGSNAYASTNGSVGSNDDVDMDQNSKVWGDAAPGPDGTYSGGSNTFVSGATVPAEDTVSMPPLTVPALPYSGVFPSTGGTLASGSYHYATAQVNSSKTLTINGPATIVCDDLRLKSNSSVVVNASNGPVTFYVVNDFEMKQNTQISSLTSNPLDVAINLQSDNILDPGIDVNFDPDTIGFDSNAKLYGTIYAPSAAITISSNFELYGSLVARRIDLDSNCRIHYDEALAEAGDNSEPSYQTLCWRLVPVP